MPVTDAHSDTKLGDKSSKRLREVENIIFILVMKNWMLREVKW